MSIYSRVSQHVGLLQSPAVVAAEKKRELRELKLLGRLHLIAIQPGPPTPVHTITTVFILILKPLVHKATSLNGGWHLG